MRRNNLSKTCVLFSPLDGTGSDRLSIFIYFLVNLFVLICGLRAPETRRRWESADRGWTTAPRRAPACPGC